MVYLTVVKCNMEESNYEDKKAWERGATNKARENYLPWLNDFVNAFQSNGSMGLPDCPIPPSIKYTHAHERPCPDSSVLAITPLSLPCGAFYTSTSSSKLCYFFSSALWNTFLRKCGSSQESSCGHHQRNFITSGNINRNQIAVMKSVLL